MLYPLSYEGGGPGGPGHDSDQPVRLHCRCRAVQVPVTWAEVLPFQNRAPWPNWAARSSGL